MSYPAAPGSGSSSSPEPRFDLGDFLAFRYLITPGLVTIIYGIGAIVITVGALLLPASGNQGAGGIFAGLLILVFGNLYWRVILEFVMVLFRINDSLGSIDRRGRGM